MRFGLILIGLLMFGGLNYNLGYQAASTAWRKQEAQNAKSFKKLHNKSRAADEVRIDTNLLGGVRR